LEEWIDLEAELAERPEVLGEEKRAVREAVAGLVLVEPHTLLHLVDAALRMDRR
jgi:hypothetical protein